MRDPLPRSAHPSRVPLQPDPSERHMMPADQTHAHEAASSDAANLSNHRLSAHLPPPLPEEDLGRLSPTELLTGAKLGRGPALRVNQLLRVTNAGFVAMGLFRGSFTLLVGMGCGVYIAQNYNVPNVKKLFNTYVFLAKHIEETYLGMCLSPPISLVDEGGLVSVIFVAVLLVLVAYPVAVEIVGGDLQ
ncbi:hypothetical protein ACJX0J_030440, partial [Zea mays]